MYGVGSIKSMIKVIMKCLGFLRQFRKFDVDRIFPSFRYFAKNSYFTKRIQYYLSLKLTILLELEPFNCLLNKKLKEK